MHLIILVLAGINFKGKPACLYKPFIVVSKIIIKPLVSLMSSACGNRIKDTVT